MVWEYNLVIEYTLSMYEALGLISTIKKILLETKEKFVTSVVERTYDPNTGKETGGSVVQDHFWLHSKANLGHMRLCLKKEKKKCVK